MLLAILAWIPFNYVVMRRLYTFGRRFLDPLQAPWYDPSARATDADAVVGPPPALEAATPGIGSRLFGWQQLQPHLERQR